MNNLSKAELDSIKEAVAAAERETSGEIVPFVVERSEPYPVAYWKASVVTGVLALAGIIVVGRMGTGWSNSWMESPVYSAVVALLCGGLAALVVRLLPALRRLVVGGQAMDRAVHRRAMQAFLDEEVFDTRDRTGILLFVSLFERRIEVLGDSGINAQVSPDEWGDVVHVIRSGIVNGKLAEGLVSGIEKCGLLLRDRGVAIKPDDENELPDGLRMSPD